jgi:hypothetical protein
VPSTTVPPVSTRSGVMRAILAESAPSRTTNARTATVATTVRSFARTPRRIGRARDPGDIPSAERAGADWAADAPTPGRSRAVAPCADDLAGPTRAASGDGRRSAAGQLKEQSERLTLVPPVASLIRRPWLNSSRWRQRIAGSPARPTGQVRRDQTVDERDLGPRVCHDDLVPDPSPPGRSESRAREGLALRMAPVCPVFEAAPGAPASASPAAAIACSSR